MPLGLPGWTELDPPHSSKEPHVTEEILDWDADTEAPARASGSINVTFEYLGRTGPLPAEDPEE